VPQRYFIQFCKHHAHAVSPTFISLLISKINPWNFHILFQIKLATQWYAFCYFFPMKLFFFLNFMLYSQNFWKCREQENISSNFHLVGLNGKSLCHDVTFIYRNGKSLCHDVTFIYRDGRSPSFDFMLSYYNGKSPSHDVMSIWNNVYSKYHNVTFTYGDVRLLIHIVVFTGHFIKLYFCDLMMT
jgi:hypothetical protein